MVVGLLPTEAGFERLGCCGESLPGSPLEGEGVTTTIKAASNPSFFGAVWGLGLERNAPSFLKILKFSPPAGVATSEWQHFPRKPKRWLVWVKRGNGGGSSEEKRQVAGFLHQNSTRSGITLIGHFLTKIFLHSQQREAKDSSWSKTQNRFSIFVSFSKTSQSINNQLGKQSNHIGLSRIARTIGLSRSFVLSNVNFLK